MFSEVWTSASTDPNDERSWSKARKGVKWGIAAAAWPVMFGQNVVKHVVQLQNNGQHHGECLHVAAVLKMDAAFTPSVPVWEALFGVNGVPGEPEVQEVPEDPEVPEAPQPPAILGILKTAGADPIEFTLLVSGGFTTAADPAPTSDLKWLLVGASDCRLYLQLPLPRPLASASRWDLILRMGPGPA